MLCSLFCEQGLLQTFFDELLKKIPGEKQLATHQVNLVLGSLIQVLIKSTEVTEAHNMMLFKFQVLIYIS